MNTSSINLRFSVNKKSVNANNHKIIANGINVFPIMKYIVGDNPTPLLKDTRKDKLEGHQGSDINIQVAPTKKKIFSLNLKYLNSIRKPTTKEIITNMKLNVPFKISKGFNAIFSLFPFYV